MRSPHIATRESLHAGLKTQCNQKEKNKEKTPKTQSLETSIFCSQICNLSRVLQGRLVPALSGSAGVTQSLELEQPSEGSPHLEFRRTEQLGLLRHGSHSYVISARGPSMKAAGKPDILPIPVPSQGTQLKKAARSCTYVHDSPPEARQHHFCHVLLVQQLQRSSQTEEERSHPLLGIYLDKMILKKISHTLMFIEALFTRDNTRNNLTIH